MTKIEWTDEVWNPVTGCTKVSQGCKNCYAELIAKRFWGERKFTDVKCHPERLDIPLHWRKPRRVFVNSMSDLFHEDVPFEFIDKVFAHMGRTQHHTYQILTKRPKLMYDYISQGRYNEILNEAYKIDGKYIIDDGLGIGIGNPKNSPLPNVWLGVSVENQSTADERIPLLLQTPAAVRFVSYEPALGPVDFKFTVPIPDSVSGGRTYAVDALDWIIAGGESGPGARPANPDWFRSVRDQCVEAGVPFFFKQMVINGKMIKIPELDGKAWSEYPDVTRWPRDLVSRGILQGRNQGGLNEAKRTI